MSAGSGLGLITVMYSDEKGSSGSFATFHIVLAAAISTWRAQQRIRVQATRCV